MCCVISGHICPDNGNHYCLFKLEKSTELSKKFIQTSRKAKKNKPELLKAVFLPL